MSESNAAGVASASSSLMYNYLAVATVDATFPLAAAQDDQSSPVLFSVGGSTENVNRKVMWVMWRDPTVKSGWRQTEVSPDRTKDVACYAVIQAPTGQVFVAVALADGAGGTQLYVSPLLSPRADGSAWTTLDAAWVSRGSAPGGSPVQRLVAGDFFAAPGSVPSAPLLLAEVTLANGAVGRYTVDADAASTGVWSPWQPPQDVAVLHDVVVARAVAGGIPSRGTWTLYDDNKGALCLTFTAVLNEYGVSNYFSVTAPPGARALAALPDRANAGLSHLYVGGSGVAWFPSGALKNARSVSTLIAPSSQVSGVNTVLAAQGESRQSVWVLNGSQDLYYTHNAADGQETWPVPTLQARHVAHVAANRVGARGSNDLFLAGSDQQSIRRLFQDPVTTTWRLHTMDLPAPTSGQQVPSYSTVIRCVTAAGAVVPNQPVQLSSSTSVWSTVNGYAQSLSTTPVTVTTDAAGTVTIINAVSDLGTPVFTVSAPFLAADVQVDPSVELRAALAARLQANPDITTWKRADGTPLVPSTVDPALVAQVQGSINDLVANMGTLPTDGSAVTPPTTTASFRVASFGVVDAITTVAGDVLQGIESAVGAVYEYVLEPIIEAGTQLLQFFVTVGEEVLTFVVRTLMDALQLLSWLFQQIGALIGDLIALLGFLFEWDDILNTQRALEAGARDALLWAGGELASAGVSINDAFNTLIANWGAIADKVLAGNDIALNQVTTTTSKNASDASKQANAALTTSPGATFSAYQFSHGGVSDASLVDDGKDHPLAQVILDFAQGVASIVESVVGATTDLFTNIAAMVQQGTFTLKGLVVLLGAEVVTVLLQAVQALLVTLCETASDLVNAIVSDLLDRTIQIPLVSWLYEQLTGESLTVLGALSLLAAIPVTIVYKLLSGEAPFTDQQVQNLTNRHTSLVVMPWRARGLSRSARLDVSADMQDFIKGYSQVGGVVSMVCSFLYPLSLAVAVDLEKKGNKDKKVGATLSTIQAALTVLSVSGSFPFDEDRDQEYLDLAIWFTSVAEATSTSCAALIGWADVGKPGSGGAVAASKEGVQILDAGLLGVLGVVELVVAVWSFVLEMENEAKPSYHTELWDTEKLFANLTGAVGVGLESAGTLTEQPEFTAAGAAFDLVSFGLNGTRWADAVVEDVLFQVT